MCPALPPTSAAGSWTVVLASCQLPNYKELCNVTWYPIRAHQGSGTSFKLCIEFPTCTPVAMGNQEFWKFSTVQLMQLVSLTVSSNGISCQPGSESYHDSDCNYFKVNQSLDSIMDNKTRNTIRWTLEKIPGNSKLLRIQTR